MNEDIRSALAYAVQTKLLVLYAIVFVGGLFRGVRFAPLFRGLARDVPAVAGILGFLFGLVSFALSVVGFVLVAVGSVAILATVIRDATGEGPLSSASWLGSATGVSAEPATGDGGTADDSDTDAESDAPTGTDPDGGGERDDPDDGADGK